MHTNTNQWIKSCLFCSLIFFFSRLSNCVLSSNNVVAIIFLPAITFLAQRQMIFKLHTMNYISENTFRCIFVAVSKSFMFWRNAILIELYKLKKENTRIVGTRTMNSECLRNYKTNHLVTITSSLKAETFNENYRNFHLKLTVSFSFYAFRPNFYICNSIDGFDTEPFCNTSIWLILLFFLSL